ncbi:MAG: TIM barrel protein, partial [Anaerolineae bacterium]|nr:TIM barrel protein [Anaerolineae bacterium]
GLLLDTFHMNIMEADPLASLRAAAPWLGHVHLSDSNRQLPGQGHIRFDQVLRTLAEIGFEGYAAIEAVAPPDPATATLASLAFLRQALHRAPGAA